MAVLVDSSVWIDHLHKGEADLVDLLEEVQVVTHPMVIGELACGSIRDRTTFLSLLSALPTIEVATDEECHALIEREKLWGKGLGWADVHLIAAVRLSDAALWTRDKRLRTIATQLELSWSRG